MKDYAGWLVAALASLFLLFHIATQPDTQRAMAAESALTSARATITAYPTATPRPCTSFGGYQYCR